MSVEVCSYRLSLRGKPVGTHVLRTSVQGRVVQLEAQVTLQGSIGNQTVVQTSSVTRTGLQSLRFSEETSGPNERRQYHVVFDSGDGVVRATRGSGDSAEVPFVRPYSDPLALLYRIRSIAPDEERLIIPMLGKDVLAERAADTTLDTVFGPRDVRVYVLYPGGSFVYVDREAPHAILKLTQRIDGQLLDSLLVRIDEEDEMPERDEPGGRKRGKRSRGRKRRRRKPKKQN